MDTEEKVKQIIDETYKAWGDGYGHNGDPEEAKKELMNRLRPFLKDTFTMEFASSIPHKMQAAMLGFSGEMGDPLMDLIRNSHGIIKFEKGKGIVSIPNITEAMEKMTKKLSPEELMITHPMLGMHEINVKVNQSITVIHEDKKYNCKVISFSKENKLIQVKLKKSDNKETMVYMNGRGEFHVYKPKK